MPPAHAPVGGPAGVTLPSGSMEWSGDPVVSKGVVERGFTVEVDDRVVPGVLWTPEGADGTRPLVLIGHGASVHKRADYVLALGRRFVRHHGFAAAAIDGPGHGDRGGIADLLAFGEVWMRPTTTDDTVADWQATVREVQKLPEVGEGPAGYWGLSMGTLFGLPLVAAEPAVRAAVLGLAGAVGPSRGRLTADAPRVNVPVLFLQQWDDELFAREDVLALFDALGTTDKRLHVHPGGHAFVPLEAYEASEAFLADRLRAR